MKKRGYYKTIEIYDIEYQERGQWIHCGPMTSNPEATLKELRADARDRRIDIIYRAIYKYDEKRLVNE